jgi:hypothetical protein
MRKAVVIVLAALVIGGGLAWWYTGGDMAGKEFIPFDQLPPQLLKVAQGQLPDVKFSEVWRKKDGVYEIRGKNKQGKVREVEVSPSGQVVDIE